MKLLILSCLVLLSGYSVSCQKLEKLCNSDVFDWQKTQVNSYYKLSDLNSTIANQTSYYLLNETVDIKADFWFKNRLKTHNGYVIKIFTNKFLKEASDLRVDIYSHWLNDVYKELASYKSKVERDDLPKLEKLLLDANKTIDFVNHLSQLKKTVLTNGVMSQNALDQVITPLPVDRKNETLVFDRQLLDIYFNKGILQIQDFEHGTAKGNGTVVFSLYIPISLNATKYKNEKDPFDQDCKSAWLHLPKFFADKGKL